MVVRMGCHGRTEEAAALYSLFPDSKILSVFGCPEGSPMPAGEVATVDFALAGLLRPRVTGTT